MPDDLKVSGVAREPMRGLTFYFNREPTDEEMRMLHDGIRMLCQAARADNPAHPPKVH